MNRVGTNMIKKMKLLTPKKPKTARLQFFFINFKTANRGSLSYLFHLKPSKGLTKIKYLEQ